jgi:hypothetical protein
MPPPLMGVPQDLRATSGPLNITPPKSPARAAFDEALPKPAPKRQKPKKTFKFKPRGDGQFGLK